MRRRPSRARQDAKRRPTPAGCRVSRGAKPRRLSCAGKDAKQLTRLNVIRLRGRSDRSREPQGPAEALSRGPGPCHLNPSAIHVHRFVRVHHDITIAIAGRGPAHRHPLVPAVHPGDGIGLNGKGEVLMNTAVGPPDAAAVGVVADKRPDTLDPPEAHDTRRDLLPNDPHGRPPAGARLVSEPPSAQMMRAGDDFRAYALGHPRLVHEVPDLCLHPHKTAGLDPEPVRRR